MYADVAGSVVVQVDGSADVRHFLPGGVGYDLVQGVLGQAAAVASCPGSSSSDASVDAALAALMGDVAT